MLQTAEIQTGKLMEVSQTKMRKFLSRKIQQLNDIVADLDTLVTQMGPDFYRVAIFGSARIKEDSVYYQRVYELALELSKRGIDIVTGGGPGLMEAANRGAKDGSTASRSIGLPIELPFESDANAHLDVKYHHRRFSSRLDEFMRISHAIVVTPGGIGTLLELLYTWQLIQVGHIQPRPLLLLGREMWRDLIVWMKDEPLKRGLMSESDMDMITLVDSVDEIVQFLEPEIKKFRDNRKQV
jgi:uncharacterized protein (TIGR00730 family)